MPDASTLNTMERKFALISKRLVAVTCVAAIAGAMFGISTAAASAAPLSGAGSTLVAPIEAEWAAAWARPPATRSRLSGRRLGFRV